LRQRESGWGRSGTDKNMEELCGIRHEGSSSCYLPKYSRNF